MKFDIINETMTMHNLKVFWGGRWLKKKIFLDFNLAFLLSSCHFFYLYYKPYIANT